MSQARGGQNAGHYYSNITMPQEVDVTFTVAATNGLGVTSVKSNGWVNNVFMHTSTTPSANNGVTNPNPADGIIIVQLKQNYNVFLGARWNIQVPNTGSELDTSVANTAYVITTVGNTTTAQWVTMGLPVGFTPAVGQTFIAAASATITGTGRFKAVANSSVASIEVFGDPNAMLNNVNVGANSGAYIYLRALDYAAALVPPTAGSIINLSLLFDRSSVTIDGL